MEKKYYEHKCPCGNRVEIQEHHKYTGVPKVCKSGHIGLVKERRKKNSRLQEGYRLYEIDRIYTCICGCGKEVMRKKQHQYTGVPRYISGHNGKLYVCSEETKRKISQTRLERRIKHTEETKRKIFEKKKGQKYSLEFREKCRQRMKNNTFTKGKVWSKDVVEKRVTTRMKNGYVHSDETKTKQRLQKLGDKNPMKREDVRRKNSKAQVERILNYGVRGGYKDAKRGVFYSNKNQKEIKYDSSMELGAYLALENLSKVKSYDRCRFSIDYTFKDGIHKYIPDIHVIYIDDTEEIIEVKPEYLLEDGINIAKFISARDYCDKNNLLFSVWTEKNLKGGN